MTTQTIPMATRGVTAGLTSDEARIRLRKFGPNAVPDTAVHPLRRALDKLWAPVPWMLEAAIVLEIALGKYVEALSASVHRDNVWSTVLSAELVPGDIVKLSLGAVVAADVRLTAGEILLDQSMLTGESIPIEAGPGVETYAGALRPCCSQAAVR